MSKPKPKTPARSENPQDKKVPRGGRLDQPEKSPRGGAAAESFFIQNFRWRAESADLDGPFGWRKIDSEVLFREVLPKLHDFESQTWDQIVSKSQDKHHSIARTNWSRKAQARIADTEMGHVEELFSLRLTGRMRVLGERRGAVFHVLWYDPEHEVCPSARR